MEHEKLEAIERLGAAGFSMEEVAEVLQEDENAFLVKMMDDCEERRSYRKGFLRRQLELRERIFLDAKNGSGPAQTAAIKILADTAIKNAI